MLKLLKGHGHPLSCVIFFPTFNVFNVIKRVFQVFNNNLNISCQFTSKIQMMMLINFFM